VEFEEKKAEVLVIGAGAAGLSASIQAALEGCEVLVISKTPTLTGSCTVFSGGGFSLATGGMTADEHFKKTMEVGKEMNEPVLVRKLVEEAPKKVLNLEKLGLLPLLGNGFVFFKGHPPVWGRNIVNALQAWSKKVGVKIIERIYILELISYKGSIHGALGYDMVSNRMVWLHSKVVVLATGGGGALYKRNDNPPGTMGDGYALALGVGETLRDMEFVQFYPLGIASGKKKKIIAPAFLADIGAIVNKEGENLLAKYGINLHPVVSLCRDTLSRAIYQEISETGKNPPWVFLDIRGMAEEGWKDYILSWGMENIFVKQLECREKLIPISPTCHFFMGGLKVDSNCFSGVEGLYAAGEVVGGVHGANRMGGNALSEAIVFGSQAGKSTANWSKSHSLVSFEKGSILELAKRKQSVMGGKEPAKKKLISMRQEIEKLLWNDAGIIRTGEGLAKVLEKLSFFENDLFPKIKISNPVELVDYWGLWNALLVARCVAESALKRTESRGSHYRMDYPQEDDKRWLRSIEIKMKDGQLAIS